MAKKKKLLGFAAEWENIPRVRARFRKQTTWLKIACNDDGEELVRSQKTLLMNAEVKSLFEKVGYIPESTKEVENAGANLKGLLTFAEKIIRKMFKMIRQLKNGEVVRKPSVGEESQDEDDNAEEQEEKEEEEGEDEDCEASAKACEGTSGDVETNEGGEEEEKTHDPIVEASPLKKPATSAVAPKSKLIPLPPPPAPPPARARNKSKESTPEPEPFPEILPNPDAAGSGRCEAQKELDDATAEIRRLEAELGLYHANFNNFLCDRPSLTPEEQHELRQSLRGNRCRGRGRGRGQQKKPAGNTPMKKPSAQLQSMDSVELAAPSQGESDDAVPPVCKKPSMKATNETGQVIKRPAARKRAPPAENLEDRVFAKRRPPPNKGLPSYTKWCDLRDMFYEHIHPFVSQPSQKQVPAGDINGVWLMRLDFSDLWEDARMPEVLRYLYGCKDLLVKLPEPLKQKVASGLACA
eukprot:s3013_g3.t1